MPILIGGALGEFRVVTPLALYLAVSAAWSQSRGEGYSASLPHAPLQCYNHQRFSSRQRIFTAQRSRKLVPYRKLSRQTSHKPWQCLHKASTGTSFSSAHLTAQLNKALHDAL